MLKITKEEIIYNYLHTQSIFNLIQKEKSFSFMIPLNSLRSKKTKPFCKSQNQIAIYVM